MNNKKWKITLGILLLSFLFVAGYFALAAEYGSQEDPLVTLSYITDVVAPGALKSVDDKIAAKMQEFQNQLNNKMTQFSSEMEKKISSSSGTATVNQDLVDAVAAKVAEKLGSSGTSVPASEWKVIDLQKDKTATLSVGTELLLRIGDATVVSTGTPGLINLTSASETNNGAALQKNNLYIVTIDGRGVKAASNCKILIRGTYTIG